MTFFFSIKKAFKPFRCTSDILYITAFTVCHILNYRKNVENGRNFASLQGATNQFNAGIYFCIIHFLWTRKICSISPKQINVYYSHQISTLLLPRFVEQQYDWTTKCHLMVHQTQFFLNNVKCQIERQFSPYHYYLQNFTTNCS